MKKFTIIGLILAIVAVGVLLASTEVFTAPPSGKKEMKIKVKKATGKIEAVLHGNDAPATPVSAADLQQIYSSPDGFKFVGVILHTHSSPGCYYWIFGGEAYKVCW